MDNLLLPLLVVGAISVPALLRVLIWRGVIERPAAARARLWQLAAQAAALQRQERGRSGLTGWAGDLRVSLSRYGVGSLSGTRIAVSGGGLSGDVTIRPEGFGGSVHGAGVHEIEVGDEAFDRAAWVEGPPALVRSLLDADNRAALRGLFDGRLERKRLSPFWATGRLDDGVLHVDVPEEVPSPGGEGLESRFDMRVQGMEPAVGRDYVGGRERLPEVLQAVLVLARGLQTPRDVPRRLADNLKAEPVAGVRAQILTTLARELPRHPATREALLAGRGDPDAEVRLRAGMALGPEGREVLLGVASGEGAEDATTQRAVVALGPLLSPAEARSILGNALRTGREATARACLSLLGGHGGAGVVVTLAKVLAIEKPALAAAAAEALGATGDAAAEAPLVRALRDPQAAVRLAAARALGQVGTTAAVVPLKEREALDGALRAAARQAIAEIQSRASGAAPGQLSLADGESGQLSLASAKEGRLSLAPPSPGAPGPGRAAGRE